MLEPAIPKNALLIFDFDQTIVNGHMQRVFSLSEKNDFNSGKDNAVTKQDIKEFLQNSGIKNEEKLKRVLQSALSKGIGVEVAIASFTSYPKAVEDVVKNRLGLTETKAQNIKVVGGTGTGYQNSEVRKNLHILYLLKAYKDKHGVLPEQVMLVDDDQKNINLVNTFHENIEKLLEKKDEELPKEDEKNGLKNKEDEKNGLKNIDQKVAGVDISEDELKKITFKGINVPGKQITGTDGAANDDYLDEVEKWIEELTPNFQDIEDSGTFLTTPPSYKSKDGSEKSLLSESEFGINSDATSENKKTNRIWPRAKYAIQQKGFIIFSAAAIMFSASAALVYLQDKAKFAALFANGSLYVTIPVIALASLLAISAIFFSIKQFRNTREYQTQGKDADEILAKVLEHQPKDKVIKSVRLEYSNGTHSNFVFNAWESKNDLINIDEKVVSRTNKIESVINDRPLFTALLASVVAANVALPLGLLTTGGVQTFYQNPLTNNIGLSLLVCSGALALLILCLGVHYYRKTNCTSLIYSQEKIDTENVNKKFVEEIERERTNVLKENHGKDAKCCSLTLEQVVVQSHNCKDAVYSVG